MLKPWFLNFLLIVAIVVASGRFFDVVGRRPEDIPQVAPPPPPKVRPVTRERTLAADFQDMVDKNLFDAERGKTETAVQVSPQYTPPPVQPPKASLFGVMIDPDGNKFAFLKEDKDEPGSQPRRYREGETLSGAQIKEIRPDRVIFTVGAMEHTIALRAPKEGLAAFQPPAADTTPAPAVRRRPATRRAPVPAQSPQSRRRAAPVRRRSVPDSPGNGFDDPWGGEDNPFDENSFEENPFGEPSYEDEPFEENPFEENPFDEGAQW